MRNYLAIEKAVLDIAAVPGDRAEADEHGQDVAGYLRDVDFGHGAAPEGVMMGLGLMGRPQYNFDMGLFLRELVSAFILLGRAPGFRRAAVEAAFRNARQSYQSSWGEVFRI